MYAPVSHDSNLVDECPIYAMQNRDGRQLFVRIKGGLTGENTPVGQVEAVLKIKECPRCNRKFRMDLAAVKTIYAKVPGNGFEVLPTVEMHDRDVKLIARIRADSAPRIRNTEEDEEADSGSDDEEFVQDSHHFNMDMRFLDSNPYRHDPSLQSNEDIHRSFTRPVELQIGGKKTYSIPFRKSNKSQEPKADPGKVMTQHYTGKNSNPHLALLQTRNGITRAYQFARSYRTQFADSHKFEWCHIKGEALGGETERSNLFCGSFGCNTYMLVLEKAVGLRANAGLKVVVTLHYDRKQVVNAPTGTRLAAPQERFSSKAFPLFVEYRIEDASFRPKATFWINSRTSGFNRDDAAAVQRTLDAAGVKIHHGI